MNESCGSAFGELVSVMSRLRAPDGCPWDREQTLESLRAYIVEEAYELVDAVTKGDSPD
ncbi:MAG: nucleoside triphosphate pyrophosphohydrolase, partial [Aminivibrio sp.]|nr:nucleoside triphosphate pyrophosphohydrolase [Aminivibrio sp.]